MSTPPESLTCAQIAERATATLESVSVLMDTKEDQIMERVLVMRLNRTLLCEEMEFLCGGKTLLSFEAHKTAEYYKNAHMSTGQQGWHNKYKLPVFIVLRPYSNSRLYDREFVLLYHI